MSQVSYTVAPGDNLWNIAKRHLGAGHRWPEIYALNRQHIQDPNRIRAGQRFALPPRNRYGLPSHHPLQRAHPRIAPLHGAAPTTPHPNSTPAPTTSTGPSTPSFPNGTPGLFPDPLLNTQVNNIAIKFDLTTLPAVEYPVPGAVVKISWAGQIFIWRDGIRPLNTIGDRGLELQEKRNASKVLHDLLETRKLTIGLDKRITYEDLMSLSTYGSSSTRISSGFTVTSSSPFLTYRTQIKHTTPALGRIMGWLFAAPDLTINFDVELRPTPPSASMPQPVRVPAPMPILVPQPVAPGLPARSQTASDPEAGRSTLQKVEDWAWEHKYEIAATVALGILTLGASAEIEGAALATRAAVGVAARAVAGRAILGAGM